MHLFSFVLGNVNDKVDRWHLFDQLLPSRPNAWLWYLIACRNGEAATKERAEQSEMSTVLPEAETRPSALRQGEAEKTAHVETGGRRGWRSLGSTAFNSAVKRGKLVFVAHAGAGTGEGASDVWWNEARGKRSSYKRGRRDRGSVSVSFGRDRVGKTVYSLLAVSHLRTKVVVRVLCQVEVRTTVRTYKQEGSVCYARWKWERQWGHISRKGPWVSSWCKRV